MMQRFPRYVLLLFTAFMLLCASWKSATASPLDSATTDIAKSLSTIDRSLTGGARQLALTRVTGNKARKILNQLVSTLPFTIDAVTIDTRGQIVEVEPQSFKKVIGQDISNQPQVQLMLKEHRPVMSRLFNSVEEVHAIDAEYPVIERKGKFRGALSLLFSPEQLLRPIIEQAVAHTEVNIWVVDTEGTMLYDIMADHIGLNLFTAPLYQPFPSLLAIGRRIVAEPEGRGRYSFYRPQTNEQVTKEATWKTVSLYGKEWRIVAYRMVKE